jgi:phage shock protein E
MITFFKNLFKTIDYTSLLKKGAIVIDVRSSVEYDNGHIANAKNIPLDKLHIHIDRLKALQVPIICCCASGVRSGLASKKLKSTGIVAYNGGSWQSLNNKLDKIIK